MFEHVSKWANALFLLVAAWVVVTYAFRMGDRVNDGDDWEDVLLSRDFWISPSVTECSYALAVVLGVVVVLLILERILSAASKKKEKAREERIAAEVRRGGKGDGFAVGVPASGGGWPPVAPYQMNAQGFNPAGPAKP